ncbi:hypothetical protein [Paenibacillus macquariensis]|uniref:hypothetical protein n=1 Tax=Paenibacillus macquariensis TaxID=948756 RepID=UPI0011159B6F|nr:hypothetical protein [Paenibacillus macquariensis]MEC0089228.1 hypothetical protein [Paenibacillus macquariensis]
MGQPFLLVLSTLFSLIPTPFIKFLLYLKVLTSTKVKIVVKHSMIGKQSVQADVLTVIAMAGFVEKQYRTEGELTNEEEKELYYYAGHVDGLYVNA